MHWYKRNLGDYAKKAGRLSMLQHGSYTLLIDACYDRERFPTREEAIEWTWASTLEEIQAVDFVLSKFFKMGDDGVFVQHRIAEEIAEYHSKAETNKRIAIERETKRRENNTKRVRKVNESPPNQEPVTSNHNIKPKSSSSSAMKDFESFWTSYPRKVGKAAALKSWKRLSPELSVVMKTLEWQVKQEAWQDKQYIPHPATWLNQGRWDDEPEGGAGAVNGKPWFLTASGITNKALEIGIKVMPNEAFPDFKARVLSAACVNADDVRKAQQDYSEVKR